MQFRAKLDREFIVTAELNPPLGVDCSSLVRRALPLAPAFDGFAVTDDSLAKLRMNAMAFAHILQMKIGIPVLMHLTCRDMSILKICDYLLGAWALDIRNVVCMTGDPPRIGSFKEMKGIFQLNSFQLCRLVSELNKGRLPNDEKLKTSPDYLVGCVSNPYSPNLRGEAKRLEKKFDNGARFVITQPIYTTRTLEEFLEATAHIPIKKVVGVLPLRGLKYAQMIAESVPDIYMPAEIFKRLERNDSLAEGVRLAQELIGKARDAADGIHIFPLNHFDTLYAILDCFPERKARVVKKDAGKKRPSTASAEIAPPKGGGNGRRRPRPD